MYLSNDLASAVQRYAHIPISQTTFQNTDLYALADDSIKSKLVPLILKSMAEFYVYPYNYSIQNGVSKYAIPPRAINMILRSVQVVNSGDPDMRVNLEQLNIEDLFTSISGNSRFLIKKQGFYIEGNNVVLYPSVQQGVDTLRLNYFIRPNQLVDVTACAQVQSVNLTANTITCVSVPGSWTTSNIFDCIKAQPGFDCTCIDQSISNINGNVITFTSALPTNISVGDYVCLAGQSCVIQVPPELIPLLTQYVVVRVMSAQGNQAGLKAAQDELEVLEKNASMLLTPRVQGSIKRVTNGRPISRLV